MIDLLLVLGLLVLGPVLSEGEARVEGDELPAQSGKSSKSSPPAPAPAPVQEGERPHLSASEIKLLKDSNIFAPRSAKRPVSKSSSRSDRTGRSEASAAPAKPKPAVVTGIFFDAKAQGFCVVVEDRNSDSLKQFKEPKFLKAGDEVAGYKVSSVSSEKAVFVKGEITKELKVGESMPGADGSTVSAAPPIDDPELAPFLEGDEKVEIKPQDEETKNKTLEEMRKKVGKKSRPSREE